MEQEPKEEQIINNILKEGEHEEIYRKFKKEIWDLRTIAMIWLKEEITDARFREIIGQYLLKVDKDWQSKYSKVEEEKEKQWYSHRKEIFNLQQSYRKQFDWIKENYPECYKELTIWSKENI